MPANRVESKSLAEQQSVQRSDQGKLAMSDTQEEEIKSLEAIIDKLDSEKRALKMRLNAIKYHRAFQVAHCRKWLQTNYAFDRKDTPELLASIFENYLLQNSEITPLPHQLIVKNSATGQRHRRKLLAAQSSLPRKKVSALEVPRRQKEARGDPSDELASA